MFFKGTLFQKWVSVVFAIGLLFYIQANILVWGHGYLDGHTINWNTYLISVIIDSLVWIGIIALSLLKYEKLFKYITISSIFLLVIQAGGLLSLVYLSPRNHNGKVIHLISQIPRSISQKMRMSS